MVNHLMLFGMVSDEILSLIDDLDLFPGWLLTPTLFEVLRQEFLHREFELTDNEKEYTRVWLDRMQKRAEQKRKRSPLPEPPSQLRFNWDEMS